MTELGPHVDPHRVRLLQHLALDRTYVRGEGSWLWDAQGRAVLDLTSQYGAVPLGHNPPALWAALDRVRAASIPALTQPSRPWLAEELGARLLAHAPLACAPGVPGVPGDGTVTFASSGAEAVEVALEQCRRATGRGLVVAAERGYHGQTLGAAALTWSRAQHFPEAQRLPGVAHVPWNDVAALEALFAARGADVAALVLEPLQGEGGVHAADPAWFARARALCDLHGAALVLDEVQTGLGRTGALFAGSDLGVRADAIVLSKALGGGLVPLAACLTTRALHVEGFALRHGSTFANNNLTCAVGLALLDALEADDQALVRRARVAGARFKGELEAIAARHPGSVRAVRGQGLLVGVELAEIGPERSFFLAHLEHVDATVGLAASWLLDRGVRVIPGLGRGRTLRLEPSLTVSDDELARGLEALDALANVYARGDWAALVRPVIGARQVAVRDLRALDRPVLASSPAEPAERAARFAFLMHPTSPDDHARTTPAFAGLSPSELRDLTDWAAARPSHAPVCFLPAVRSAAGALAQGWLVSLTDTPASFRERPRDEVVRDVRAAAETARRLGADVLGLGAFTSIVTRNGDDLHDLPLAVTTGNALTVALAIEGVAHATGRLGRDLDRSRGCVLGLGAVGSAAASLLAERVPDLVLCGNPVRAERDARRALELADAIYARAARDLGRPEARGVARALREASLRWLAQGPADRRRLRALLARLRSLGKSDGDVDGLALEVAWACAQEGSAAPVRFESARGPALRAADVVVSATSDPGGVIGPAELRRGAVVCDVARPADVGAVVVAARPDVLVFEGGLARWPEAVSFGQHLGYAPGVALACLTETVVLALDGVTAGRFGRVSSLAEEARSIRAAAARHGFGLAELHRAGRPITDAELDAVKRAARPRHQTAA